MSKPTSYDLLIQVTRSIERVEDKLDKRMDGLDGRIQITETKLDQMIGKIGIGVIVITVVASTAISFFVDLVKKGLGR